MKTFYFAAVIASLFAGAAGANCKLSKPGYLRASHPGMLSLAAKQQPPVLQPAASPSASPEASVTGYWYVRFFAEGQLVDDGFDVWTSDGTEILNDSPSPLSGNVCLGVWVKTDSKSYALKHPSWIFDDAGVNLVGIAIIREQVSLDPGGNSMTGTFTVDVYDLAGNVLDHETGTMTGTRINALDDKGAYPSPIPGLPASILNR